MYYKYTAESSIIMPLWVDNDLLFKIVLKENMPFKLGQCYLTINKNHDHSFKISDEITVSFFSNDSALSAAQKYIKESIEFIIFLTGIPFETNNHIQESQCSQLPFINLNQSKIKMEQIKSINCSYQNIRAKRNLMVECMQLFATGTKLNFLSNYLGNDDAFFAFFKIIEKISKDEFKTESNTINKGKSMLTDCVKNIYHDYYGITTIQAKLNEVAGILANNLFHETFNELFHQILFSAKKRKIVINENKLHKIIKIRNAIAHGDLVDFSSLLQEYIYTMELSNKFIRAKFFSSMPKIEIPSKIEST